MMDDKPPVSLVLEKLGVPHQVFHHERPVTSFEQAARDRGHRPSQIVRSILFRVREGEHAMVLVAGQAQVSWKILRKLLGRSRISMASGEEVLEVTGYRVGTVGPFGLLKQVQVLMDAGVLSEEEVSIGSGLRDRAIILKSADLKKALGNVEVVHLIEHEP
jgi:Cys-tRNA(Pro)/Cys-tRNA(Cys) deacylase